MLDVLSPVSPPSRSEKLHVFTVHQTLGQMTSDKPVTPERSFVPMITETRKLSVAGPFDGCSLIDLQDAGPGRFPAKTLQDAASTRLPRASAKGRVLQQPIHSHHKGLRVLRVAEPTGEPVLDHFGKGPRPSGHNRGPAGHGLGDGQPEPLQAGRKEKDLGSVQETNFLLLRDGAQEVDPVGHVAAPRPIHKGLALWTLPGNEKMKVRVTREESSKNVRQDLHILPADETPYKGQDARAWLQGSGLDGQTVPKRPKTFGIDAVRNDMDPISFHAVAADDLVL